MITGQDAQQDVDQKPQRLRAAADFLARSGLPPAEIEQLLTTHRKAFETGFPSAESLLRAHQSRKATTDPAAETVRRYTHVSPPVGPWDTARLRDIEDRAGFRRSHLTAAERRIRSYFVREIRRRGRTAVEFRTGRIAEVLGFHPNTIRHARDFLCDRKAGGNGNRREGIGYLRVIRHSLGGAWLLTLGWETVEELRTVAARLLQRRPTRPRRGRKLVPSWDPSCETTCDPACDPDPTPKGSQPGARAPDPDRLTPVSTDLRIYGSAGSTEETAGKPTAAELWGKPKAPVSQQTGRQLFASPSGDLRIWCLAWESERTEQIEEFLELAERMGLEEGFAQLIADACCGDWEEILTYCKKAAYEPGIENPGGWLRQALRRRFQFEELGEL